MRTTHMSFSLLMLPFLSGCSDHWESGTWIEEDFAVRDDACDWASGIIAPDEAHHYTLGDLPENDSDYGDDYVLVISGNESLADTLSSSQDRADNFWDYCSQDSNGFSGSLEFDCEVAIQLVQPDLGLDSYFTKLCGSTEDTRIYSWTNGLLIREGEAFMNHYISLSCDDESGGGDTGYTEDSDDGSSCSMTYSSWLKKK